MSENSSIEWTDATWNPVDGCTIVSPGCSNCYAMRIAARLEAMGQRKYIGTTRKSGQRQIWTGKISLDERSLHTPISWKAPRRIFVNSMSDLFHERVSVDFIAQVWDVMETASWHTYQILTKRPERMATILSECGLSKLPHVWLGTSVENEDYLDRLEQLRQTPASVRFVSFEPLLGRLPTVDLSGIDWVTWCCSASRCRCSTICATASGTCSGTPATASRSRRCTARAGPCSPPRRR